MVQFVPDAPTPTALGTATFVTYESNYYSVMPGEGVEPSSQRPTKHPWHHLAVTPVGLCTWEFGRYPTAFGCDPHDLCARLGAVASHICNALLGDLVIGLEPAGCLSGRLRAEGPGLGGVLAEFVVYLEVGG